MGSIEAALTALKSQNPPNYNATAKEYGVNRTTLSRRHRGITGSTRELHDSISILTKQQEKTLVEYINKLTNRGLPPTTSMVLNFAADIGKHRPNRCWVARFVKRHSNELQSGFLSGFDLSRKKADNYYQYSLFFEQVCNP